MVSGTAEYIGRDVRDRIVNKTVNLFEGESRYLNTDDNINTILSRCIL